MKIWDLHTIIKLDDWTERRKTRSVLNPLHGPTYRVSHTYLQLYRQVYFNIYICGSYGEGEWWLNFSSSDHSSLCSCDNTKSERKYNTCNLAWSEEEKFRIIFTTHFVHYWMYQIGHHLPCLLFDECDVYHWLVVKVAFFEGGELEWTYLLLFFIVWSVCYVEGSKTRRHWPVRQDFVLNCQRWGIAWHLPLSWNSKKCMWYG